MIMVEFGTNYLLLCGFGGELWVGFSLYGGAGRVWWEDFGYFGVTVTDLPDVVIEWWCCR